MALIYRHRVNTIDELEKIPTGLGIEFDLRSEGNDLIVTHDPFTNGPKLEEFLRFVGPRPCIVNVKCEGLVESALAALDAASIRQFFFLDLPMADQVLLKRAGRTEFAIAYSEYEPAPLAMVWARKANWVWIDCWTDYPK